MVHFASPCCYLCCALTSPYHHFTEILILHGPGFPAVFKLHYPWYEATGPPLCLAAQLPFHLYFTWVRSLPLVSGFWYNIWRPLSGWLTVYYPHLLPSPLQYLLPPSPKPSCECLLASLLWDRILIDQYVPRKWGCNFNLQVSKFLLLIYLIFSVPLPPVDATGPYWL